MAGLFVKCPICKVEIPVSSELVGRDQTEQVAIVRLDETPVREHLCRHNDEGVHVCQKALSEAPAAVCLSCACPRRECLLGEGKPCCKACAAGDTHRAPAVTS